MTQRYDIAIIGGGPAGSAFALSLKKHAPSLTVAIIESSDYERQRIGESLPPTVQPLLNQLGVWKSFLAENHLPAYGTCSAWGSHQLESNEFIYGQHGRGWHLDRRRFDVMLAREAEKLDVKLMTSSTVTHSERLGDEWLMTVRSQKPFPSTKTHEESTKEGKDNSNFLREPSCHFVDGNFRVSARFVVDASGKTAAFATRHGARKQLFDQLLGAFVFFNCEQTDSYTMVEACENGWWYSALLPGSGMVAAWMSDADFVKQHSVKEPASWFEQLQKTTHTKRRLLPAEPLDTPTLHSAASHKLDSFTGKGWLAVGDAATSFDPLSSQGVFKALRTGILASYAVCDFFKGDLSGLDKYEQIVTSEFDAYLKTRAEFYGQERRWPNSPFWKRRSSEHRRSEYRL
ncbi:MAG: tryptophan 7-halogenase [Acidobacteria bacterium]|nr:tryptophan 7-halogenase [Acidobacteriota bacterium]